MFIRLPIPQFYMDSLNNKTVLLFLQVNALLKTYCPLNCSLNGTDLVSLDEKGGSIPLSAYTVLYLKLQTYWVFNTLWI